ncbi:MAG: UDP-N-acetylglucosamine 1-carboxyvinyltransferase [bacterium]
MAKLVINGPTKLSGEISVCGSKNAALKIIPASILSKETITINNLPDIEDISRSLELIEYLGAKVSRSGSVCKINTENITKVDIPPNIANKIRASIMFVGPLLARFGEVYFPHPGGCVIGAGIRPIDFFIEGFAKMGTVTEIKDGMYRLTAKKLSGCEYFFAKPSVTGTESLMMTATLSFGITTLKNCAMEPEIKALAEYLVQQGAKIEGAGTPTICIRGVDTIHADNFDIIPDRIETGTFAIMAAATKSQLIIKKCIPEHIESLLSIFQRIGIDFDQGSDFIKIKPTKKFLPYNIMTHEYPGFPTDLQSPFTVLMTQAEGTSLIHETIYDRRLLFTDMLTQMGADITMCDPHRVVVYGPTKLYGRKLTSPDLRAGIAMIIAALVAKGETEIDNIYQIDRGYESIDKRLSPCGAKVRRTKD